MCGLSNAHTMGLYHMSFYSCMFKQIQPQDALLIVPLYLSVFIFPANGEAVQESSYSSGQNSEVVTNTHDWELDNSDSNRGPGVNMVSG